MKEHADIKLSPLVQELSGTIELPEDFDLQEEYAKYLTNKYLTKLRLKPTSIKGVAHGSKTHAEIIKKIRVSL